MTASLSAIDRVMRFGAAWPALFGFVAGLVLVHHAPGGVGARNGLAWPGPGRLAGVPAEGAAPAGVTLALLRAEANRLDGALRSPGGRTSSALRARAHLDLVDRRPEAAIDHLETALDALPSGSPARAEAVLRNDLAVAHLVRFAAGGPPTASLDALDEAARAVEIAPDLREARDTLAEIERRLGLGGPRGAAPGAFRPSPARSPIADLERALALGSADSLARLAVPAPLAPGIVSFRAGLAARQRQDLASAATAFAAASARLAAAGSPLARSADYWRAEVAYQQGDYAAALAWIAPLTEARDPLLAGRASWLDGTIATQRGQLQRAREAFESAHERLRAAGEAELSAVMLDLLAENLRLRGSSRAAWSMHLEALAELGAVTAPARRRQILSGAGATAALRGRLAAAERLESASYAAVEAGGAAVAPTTRAHAARLRAELALRRGRLAEARAAFDEAKRRVEEIPDPAARRPIGGDLLLLGARIATRDGEAPAPAAIERALRQLDQVEAGTSFRSLVQRQVETAAQRARLLALAGRRSEAARALGQAEALAAAHRLELSAERTARVRAAFAALAAVAIRQGEPTAALEALAHGECWRPAAPARCPELAAAAFARALPADAVTLLAWPGDGELLVAAARRDAPPVAVAQPVGRGEIARLAERFRERPGPETGARLAALLLDPIRSRLRPGDRLFAALDGELAALPLAALPIAPGRSLVEESTPVLVRRLAALPREVALGGSSRSPSALVVGVSEGGLGLPPLPAAQEEARAVAAALPNARALIAGEARRAPILAVLREVELFHFAGHATRSGLVLGPGEGEMIPASDLAAHAGRLRLAVLSACRTGSPEGVDAETELARALLDAGVPAVIASTAPVRDSHARALFVRFYGALRAGRNPADALRTAQLDLLRASDPDLRAPAAWGRFVLWLDASEPGRD